MCRQRKGETFSTDLGDFEASVSGNTLLSVFAFPPLTPVALAVITAGVV
ncbi:hypothetical protein ACDP63_17650 [Paracoccus sp. P2]|nr:hypothetical protein [Paracoccus pantotrophus]